MNASNVIALLLPIFLLAIAAKKDQSNYLKRSAQKYMSEVASRPGVYKLGSGVLIEVCSFTLVNSQFQHYILTLLPFASFSLMFFHLQILESSTKADAKSPYLEDKCLMKYAGYLKDGTKVEGGKANYAPNQVIKGWTEAVSLSSTVQFVCRFRIRKYSIIKYFSSDAINGRRRQVEVTHPLRSCLRGKRKSTKDPRIQPSYIRIGDFVGADRWKAYC